MTAQIIPATIALPTIGQNVSKFPNLEEFLRDPMNLAMTMLTARALACCDPGSPREDARQLPFDAYDRKHLSEGGTIGFFAGFLGVQSPASLQYLCERVSTCSDNSAKLGVVQYDTTKMWAMLFLNNDGSKAEIEMGASLPRIFRYTGR